MTPEQQAAIITAWGTVASAIGTIVSAIVAGIAIRAAKQANKTSARSLLFAQEERSAALRETVFQARVALIQDVYASSVDLMHMSFRLNFFRQTDLGEESITRRAAEVERYEKMLNSALDEFAKVAARASAICTTEYIAACNALMEAAMAMHQAKAPAASVEAMKNIEAAWAEFGVQSRSLAQVEKIDAHLLSVLGSPPSSPE